MDTDKGGLGTEADSGFFFSSFSLNRQATEEPFQEVPRCRQDQGPQEEQELNITPDGLVMAGRKEKEAEEKVTGCSCRVVAHYCSYKFQQMTVLMETWRHCRGLLMTLIMVITLLKETKDGKKKKKKTAGYDNRGGFLSEFSISKYLFSITMAHRFVFSAVLLSWP